ncbi:hypothetical protein BGW80DRAFT_1320853 [Lactifluus volemus]|nr:hypothetical protein BGW80DRAFT_1320853 [Lactifluus volemus]
MDQPVLWIPICSRRYLVLSAVVKCSGCLGTRNDMATAFLLLLLSPVSCRTTWFRMTFQNGGTGKTSLRTSKTICQW